MFFFTIFYSWGFRFPFYLPFWNFFFHILFHFSECLVLTAVKWHTFPVAVDSRLGRDCVGAMVTTGGLIPVVVGWWLYTNGGTTLFGVGALGLPVDPGDASGIGSAPSTGGGSETDKNRYFKWWWNQGLILFWVKGETLQNVAHANFQRSAQNICSKFSANQKYSHSMYMVMTESRWKVENYIKQEDLKRIYFGSTSI